MKKLDEKTMSNLKAGDKFCSFVAGASLGMVLFEVTGWGAVAVGVADAGCAAGLL